MGGGQMNHYLFLARSVTHAQDMAKVLGQSGIHVKVRRAGPGMSERGCVYSLEVAENRFAQAKQALKESGKLPVKVFFVSNGKRQEVRL